MSFLLFSSVSEIIGSSLLLRERTVKKARKRKEAGENIYSEMAKW